MLEKRRRAVQLEYYVTLQYDVIMSSLDTIAGDSCLTMDIMSFSHRCHGSCIFHIVTRMTAVCSQLCYMKCKGEISLRSKRNRFEIGKKGRGTTVIEEEEER